ncbi:uncharacterized protein LOC136083793 [Hydra vulgaris]|uniref:Uncharacterized protein LOC136083793 n=1 Tax=Hydra vulgaris TaxID=6087 RepID=A0ABM4CD78_HYDVU
MQDKLQQIIKFIVQVYAVSWFEIKLDNKFHNQQLYIFNMIKRIKEQSEEIKIIALKNLQHNAFALLPENLLYSMIKSDEYKVREAATRKILSIRNMTVHTTRLNKITAINTDAYHWSDLVDLSQTGICEPAFTEHILSQHLQESLLNGTKFELPVLPSHTQSLERAVKMTSEACHTVYGIEARHKHIIAKKLSRQKRPNFSSKDSYCQKYDDVVI